ncbi:hypothetical protein AVEN_242756-1 [Araneus ventricosus]|uniref:Uncharacterized protein n=1 Tax=Araneus ventricosus TaxID=182803 RepID=A0A4Y2PNB8_ARAVE|nr:hypothetical protein AVEN_113222-1 [Araneus ventricosus]GBN52358.1 hypothetical protein AVEN_207345-1 [Araneus ventricosus]GBN52681.1 hypothetical protein AVEN_47387-1 [Araneus ventricosus]GBN52682.1 hypothetical protein AVEN_242756-1 [Araneus ventricosus]
MCLSLQHATTFNRVHMSSLLLLLLSHYTCTCLNEIRPLEIFTYDCNCVMKRDDTIRWSVMDGTDFLAYRKKQLHHKRSKVEKEGPHSHIQSGVIKRIFQLLSLLLEGFATI